MDASLGAPLASVQLQGQPLGESSTDPEPASEMLLPSEAFPEAPPPSEAEESNPVVETDVPSDITSSDAVTINSSGERLSFRTQLSHGVSLQSQVCHCRLQL